MANLIVTYTWEKKSIYGDRSRVLHLSYPVSERGSNGCFQLDKDLSQSLEEVGGVDFVSNSFQYEITVYFAKMFDREKVKPEVVQAVGEWIANREKDLGYKWEQVRIVCGGTQGPPPTTKHYDKVKLFMQNGGQETPDCITIPDDKTRLLRARLIFEEALETIYDGLGLNIVFDGGMQILPSDIQKKELGFEVARPVNLVALADGCADTKVVTTGTLIACGIPDDKLQDIVDDSNLAKGSTKDEHGKIQKPPGWSPPDVLGFLSDLNKSYVACESLGLEEAPGVNPAAE